MSQERNTLGIGTISHFFSVNHPLSILLLIGVLLFGLFSFYLTAKQYNPEIVRPAFAITMHYQGATVGTASERVVYELVEKIRTVPGVDDIYTEVHDGATIHSTVIFNVGYDAEKAKLDLLSQIEQHEYLARGFIQPPHIQEINPETIPILQIVFGGENLTTPQLREKVTALSRRLTNVPDVSELSVYGGYTPSLVVEVDTQKLANTGVSLSSLIDTLAASQLRTVSSGVHSGNETIELLFDGSIKTASEIGLLQLTVDVAVRDVAEIYEGSAGDRSYVIHQTKEDYGEVITLSVAKVEGSSAPVVSDNVRTELISLLAESEYDGLTYKVVSDDGQTASKEIYGLTKNLLTSIGIVALVLVVFLSGPAAAVVLIAIPSTLLIVFGLGFLFDQTINRITLFALILSLGLLVDSAIVVTENIYEHLKAWHKNGRNGSRTYVIAQAVREIGAGLVLSTVTSVIVFLPMAFITGMMGPYMGPIAFFVPAALLTSLFVAIVITPFVATHILHGNENEKTSGAGFWFGKYMQKLTDLYTAFLRTILYSRSKQKKLLQNALLLFVVSLVLPAVALVHFQMLPKADLDQFYVYIDLPIHINVEGTKDFTSQVSSLLISDQDVLDVQHYIATAPIIDFNGMFKGAQYRNKQSTATLRVNLVSKDDRSRSSTRIVTDLREHTKETLGLNSSNVRFMEEPPGPPVQATLVAKVISEDSSFRTQTTQQLQKVITDLNGVVDVDTSIEEPVSQVLYQFDHEKASELGISVIEAQRAFMLLGNTYEVTELLEHEGTQYTPIVLTLDQSAQDTPSDIYTTMLTTNSGESLPLSSVLSAHHQERTAKVNFDGASPVSLITAEVEGRSIVYVMIDLIHSLIQGSLSDYTINEWNLFGMHLLHTDSGQTIELVWGGEWEMTLENFRDLGIAMIVSLLMVYGVLVAQYNRFAAPAYILVTVPLGLIGILWGFTVLDITFGIYLTATALIGFIALIGIVVNNAIIFLEYVTQKQKAGVSYREALIAAGQARLRPILLTSLTTILGSLTIVGDPVWSGLAWAIVFGLSLSTILTLIIYPTLLIYFTAPSDE